MEFLLNGRRFSLDAAGVLVRVAGMTPKEVETHWVEIGGIRWPVKQAFRIVLDLSDADDFTSHRALRVFQRLGFATSAIPQRRPHAPAPRDRDSARPRLTDEDAAKAFRRLDAFLTAADLTTTLAAVEREMAGMDKGRAQAVAAATGFDKDLVDCALVVRERVGMLDTLIHAAVITQALPRILVEGETVTKRPSLGAGNDPDRPFDLETTHRVAEFKLASWKGRDSTRERSLFADVVGLSLDQTERRRQVYVVGPRPANFLKNSSRNAAKTLVKGAALRVRDAPDISADTTVAVFTAAARIEVVDLTEEIFPELR